MSASISAFEKVAVFEGGNWSCKTDARLSELLNAATAVTFPQGITTADPNPEKTVAVEMARRFQGQVLRWSPVKNTRGAVY